MKTVLKRPSLELYINRGPGPDPSLITLRSPCYKFLCNESPSTITD